MEAFLALQQLAAAAPSYPGLRQMQQELGALALKAQGNYHAHCSAFFPQVLSSVHAQLPWCPTMYEQLTCASSV